MSAPSRNGYPWKPAEEIKLLRRKRQGARHKVIARELNRSPRSVDQHVARMKERGLLAMHRREELDLLEKVRVEAAQPERHPER